MNKALSLFLALVCASSFSWAGKVITYVGISDVSQEDADNAAYAGIAKQISADVKVEQTMLDVEVTRGNQTQAASSYTSSNQVNSRAKLEGVNIKPLSREGRNFRSEARVDIDEMTKNMQFDLNELKSRMANSEKRGWDAVEAGQYYVASEAWTDAARALVEYYSKLDEYKKFFKMDQSFTIKHRIADLENKIISALSTVELKLRVENHKLPGNEAEIVVLAKGAQGGIEDLPIQVVHEGKAIYERRTGSGGFTELKPSGLVGDGDDLCKLTVMVGGIHPKLLKASGLDHGKAVEFQLKPQYRRKGVQANIVDERLKKAYKFSCNGPIKACTSIQSKLMRQGLNFHKDGSKPVKCDIVTRVTSGGGFISTYDVKVVLSGSITYENTKQGSGKNEDVAIMSALKKMDFMGLHIK